MSYRAVGSYYMIPGATAGFGSYGGLGELFFDGGKAFWKVAAGGEIISKVAQQVYGEANKWVEICKANPQGRDPQQPKGDCWYKPGTILTLPLIPGYPDPSKSAPQSGLPVAQEGTTIVTSSGQVATVGKGGTLTGPGTAKAAMGTGTMIGIGVAALALIGGMALLAKKKPGSSSSAGGRTTSTSTTTYKANRRRSRRRAGSRSYADYARGLSTRKVRDMAHEGSTPYARKIAKRELRRRGARLTRRRPGYSD